MGMLDTILGRETRVKASDPYLAEFFGQRSGIGGYVNPERASGQAVAMRCHGVIAENIAGLPLKVYAETKNGGRDVATDHPLYAVLHDQMNPSLTAFEGREWLVMAVLIYGNAYARIERDGRGQVTGLYPFAPGNVSVERMPSGRLRYKVSGQNGGVQILLQEEVLHLRYRTRDGVMGLSPIQIAAATFGLALAQQDQAGSQVENSFRPAGALVFPGNVPKVGKDRVLATFKDRFVGALKNNEVMILDGGAKFETFQIPNKDSEFLDSRKLSNLDVCRVYGVPPSVAGITDDATYSNIGEESRALVVRCLAPWAKRIEQAMNMALLTPEARQSYFIEHDLAGLLRGDLKTRYEAYKIGRDGGWLSSNEIRGWENLSEIDGGDSYMEPLNMKPLGDRSQTATVH